MMEKLSQEEIQLEQIQKFLLGQLEFKEKEAVEKRIEADESFAKEVEKYRFLLEGFRNREAQDMRIKMDSWEEEAATKVIRNSTYKWTYAIAASILILLAFQFLLPYFSSPPVDKRQLLADALEDFEPDLNVRGQDALDNPLMNKVLLKAFNSYSASNYQEAIPSFEKWLEQNQGDNSQIEANVYLCLGISLLRTQKTEKALEVFQQISTNSAYHEHAIWYQGLSHLNIDSVEEAQKVLIRLRSNPFYGKRADKLLKQLVVDEAK